MGLAVWEGCYEDRDECKHTLDLILILCFLSQVALIIQLSNII